MKILAILMILTIAVLMVGCNSNQDIADNQDSLSDEKIVDETVDSITDDIEGVDPEDDYVEIGEMI